MNKQTILWVVLMSFWGNKLLAQENANKKSFDDLTIQQWIHQSRFQAVPVLDSQAFFTFYEQLGYSVSPARKMFSLFRVLWNPQIAAKDRVRFGIYLNETYAQENIPVPNELIRTAIQNLINTTK
ncbi:MAG: hypothetical protein HWD58_16495 [Bacteroidota bacterium]|nr:hypothetical protein [Chitinophagaceae bacterium]QLH47078.1 MAG: hypothetical protein HWD58_16495 [Bacteroidota bacterium]